MKPNHALRAERLCPISVARYTNPHTRFSFDEPLAADRLAASVDVLSLAGHPLLARLTDEQRQRLALLEAVHVFSLNVSGERELLSGLAQRLWRSSEPAVCDYLQHMLHEENAHSAVFAAFCRRYAGKLYPEPTLSLPREYLPGEEEFLFWARVLIFEQIAIWFNRHQAQDTDVWSVVRRIHEYHAEDEGRHIAFGEALVADLWQELSPAWGSEAQRRVAAQLGSYVNHVLARHVSPAVYRDLGLPLDPLVLREEVLASPTRVALGEKAAAQSRRFLSELGVLPA